MKKNMAVGDRFVRLVTAAVLLFLFFAKDFPSPWNYVALSVAIIFLVTSFIGTCPFYLLCRIDTRQFKY